MLVLVTGGTGFLGREVVRELLSRHHRVRCLVRTPGRERIFTDRSVDVHYGSVTDPDALEVACQGVEAIVHLAAIIQPQSGASLDQINRQGTANLIAAAKNATQLKHFVHLSAIGASSNTNLRYTYSKWQGEQEVINGGLPYTILRPSIIFGEGDAFLNSMAALIRVTPIVPVFGRGRNRFQPIAAADVARCVALTLEREELKGRVIEIGGPDQPSYNQLISLVARTMGKKRIRIHMPVWLVLPKVLLMEKLLPRPPITREMLRLVTNRNVTELEAVEDTFGFTPRPLEGNIEFVCKVSYWDGLRILMGNMPHHIRDH